MIPNTERIYENLNGEEVKAIAQQLAEKLIAALDGHQALRAHLAYPNVQIDVGCVISPESQKEIKISLSEGPFFAPDKAREIFGLGLPVAVKTPEGKKATLTSPRKGKKGDSGE